MVDITMKLNELNVKLQGKGKPAYVLFEDLVSFEGKLVFFEDVRDEGLIYFEFLNEYKNKTDIDINTAYFITIIGKIRAEFSDRFQQFRSNRSTLEFVINPLEKIITEINVKPFRSDLGTLRMELNDLKSNNIFKPYLIHERHEPNYILKENE